MHEKILKTGRRAKALLHQYRVRCLAKEDWQQRFNQIYRQHPEYADPVDKTIERKYVNRWKPLCRDIHLDTLRVCSAISGVEDSRMVPEEVYVSEIEPVLNPRRDVAFLQHKSAYSRWFPGGVFPRTYIHDINGCVYGEDYTRLPPSALVQRIEKIDYPVVVKPNVDSLGGENVSFVPSADALRERIRGCHDYVVQERIQPHPYFSRFSAIGVNTLRVCLYRSVRTEQLHILNVALRMGKGGSLDNETAGGVVCCIDESGRLHDYAVDKFGQKFMQHPDSGFVFKDMEPIPDFESMKSLALQLADGVFMARLVSLDLCLDAAGRWRAIEINLFSQTIRFAQYAGHPFFGQLTDEVVDYCEARSA